MMLEEKIHRILAHPIRRRILSSIYENEHLSFSQLKKIVDIDDHGKLAYHIKSLDGIVEPDERVRGYRLTEVGHQARVLLSLRKLQDLMEIIRFTEKVSTIIHGAKDKAEIIRILREASQTTSHSLVIFLRTGDGERLRIPEGFFPRQIIQKIDSESDTALDDMIVNIEESTVFSRVVRYGETILLGPFDLLKEFIPVRLISRMKNASDMWKQPFILVPLNLQEETIGVFAMSSPDLHDPFIPSVRNLAEHVSTALRLVEEHAARIRAEEEIKEIKECYERLLDNANEAIFRVKADGGQVIFQNAAAERLFGFSQTEYNDDPSLSFKSIHPDYAETQKRLIEEINDTKKPIRNTVLGWISKDGRTILMEHTVIPVFDDDGNIVFFESIGRDITERKH